jgi:hypothetical protein
MWISERYCDLSNIWTKINLKFLFIAIKIIQQIQIQMCLHYSGMWVVAAELVGFCVLGPADSSDFLDSPEIGWLLIERNPSQRQTHSEDFDSVGFAVAGD